MSTKNLETRLKLKYDTLTNWNNTSADGKGANLVLLKGEIGICYVPAVTSGTSTTAPTVLFKVGDGTSKYSELPWGSALAADVHDWAKSPTCPVTDTNTQYQLIADGQNKVKLQSKSIGGSWADAGHSVELVQNASDGHKIGFKIDGTAPTSWITIPDSEYEHPDTARSDTTSTAAPDHGATFTVVDSVSSNNEGHVTAVNVKTVTLPEYAVATQSAAGLMSAADKVALDGMEDTIDGAIDDAIGALDKSDTAVAGQVVSAVSETDGVITVSRRALVAADIPSITKSKISDFDHDHNDLYYTESEVDGLLDDKLDANLKGSANGIAELDANGKVPTAQLPSFVDDVIEAAKFASLPSAGETGKIYVTLDDNKTYRWSGSAYVEISASLALGETASTAFRGDQGKAAYDHAQAKGSAFASGMYKITTNAEGHVTAATAVVKSDITALGIPGEDTTYENATQSAAGLMSAADKTKLDGVSANAKKVEASVTNGNIKIDGTETKVYTHASHTAKTEGLYKVAVDGEGHVSGATAVAKADITALGIPAQDTTYTFDGTYNASSNKAATVATVTNKIADLDSSVAATAADGNKYSVLTGVTEADGKLTAKTEVKLEAIAKTGNVNDLIQTSGDYLILDCGSSTTII